MVFIKLKWNKLTFDNVEVNNQMTVDELKEKILTLTNVPKDRQKLMCKGAWPAVLKDNQDLSGCKFEEGMQIMLMGTADVLQAPTTPVVFEEEMDVKAKAKAGAIAPPGLQNLGNTCYMNSVIQCLCAIPQVKSSLQQEVSTNALVTSLRGLIHSMSTSGGAVVPLQFVAAVRREFPQFNQRSNTGAYVQQDAEEFYGALNGVLANDDHIRNNYVNTMEISFEEKLECTESATEIPTTRRDSAFKLICNIQGGVGTIKNIDFMRDGLHLGLESTIEKFSESLQRNAQYKKTMRVTNLPKCLCIQFMRFFWKATPDSRDHAGVKCKILRAVAFHDKLDLYEFCNEGLQAQLREQRQQEDCQAGNYELFALVSHKGRSADSGHYMAYTRQQQDPNMWWLFDDHQVSELTTDDILKLNGGGDRDMGYLLFFRHLG